VIIVVIIILSLIALVSAIMAIISTDMVSSIIFGGVVSLVASVIYLVYGSPDVAMTEAAIGSGLTTVVFLFAWFRVKHLGGKE